MPSEPASSEPEPTTRVAHVLQGSNDDSYGAEVELDLVLPGEPVVAAEAGVPALRKTTSTALPDGFSAWGVASPSHVPVLDERSFRTVPLLAVMPTGDRLLVAVGDVRVQGRGDALPLLTVVLSEVWEAPPTGVRKHSTDRITWSGGAGHKDLHGLLIRAFNKTSAYVATRGIPDSEERRPATDDELVTALAKGLAEQSRNAVQDLREVRYRMERQLGRTLREKPDTALNDLLADVVELTLAAGRARDEARDAVREGFWIWRTKEQDAVYQALRRQLDPTLRAEQSSAAARDVSWFNDLESGVVQARSMDALLAEEVVLLHSLLDSASTVSVARDAKAQEDFNYVAAVGGVGVGLLALVLALYSASDIVPLGRANYVRLLVPLAVAALPAIFLAVWLRREREKRVLYFLAGVVVVSFALGLLAFAGSRVPAPPETEPEPVFIVPSPPVGPPASRSASSSP